MRLILRVRLLIAWFDGNQSAVMGSYSLAFKGKMLLKVLEIQERILST